MELSIWWECSVLDPTERGQLYTIMRVAGQLFDRYLINNIQISKVDEQEITKKLCMFDQVGFDLLCIKQLSYVQGIDVILCTISHLRQIH